MATAIPASLAATYTFTAGTYTFDANCDCNSNTVVYDCSGGDIIIKRSGDYYFTEVGVVNTTNSDATHRVIWTVKNDDTVGETIEGSTGVPAVLGGSYNNAVAIGNYSLTFNFWEIRWVNNTSFIVSAATASLRSIQNIEFKNCTYSSVVVFNFNAQSLTNTSNVFTRIQLDSTNTLSGTFQLLVSAYANRLTGNKLEYIFVENSTSTSDILSVNTAYITTFNYIKIKTAGYGLSVNDRISCIFSHCKTTISLSSTGGSASFKFKNCVFTDNAYGIRSGTGHNSRINSIRVFNCLFKGLTTSAIVGDSSARIYVEALRNCIFDSCASICTSGADQKYGIKNNGYYDITSYTNWVAGSYDTWINQPNWTNFPNGTLHTDWLTYGPGDGWYTTEDIPTGADTNSFVGIDVATQSHTGATETATTQRLGLAPVFSALE
jgi:hypothetical protein